MVNVERRTVVEMLVPQGIEPEAVIRTLEDAIKRAYGRNVKAYKRHLRPDGGIPPRKPLSWHPRRG